MRHFRLAPEVWSTADVRSVEACGVGGERDKDRGQDWYRRYLRQEPVEHVVQRVARLRASVLVASSNAEILGRQCLILLRIGEALPIARR